MSPALSMSVRHQLLRSMPSDGTADNQWHSWRGRGQPHNLGGRRMLWRTIQTSHFRHGHSFHCRSWRVLGGGRVLGECQRCAWYPRGICGRRCRCFRICKRYCWLCYLDMSWTQICWVLLCVYTAKTWSMHPNLFIYLQVRVVLCYAKYSVHNFIIQTSHYNVDSSSLQKIEIYNLDVIIEHISL